VHFFGSQLLRCLDRQGDETFEISPRVRRYSVDLVVELVVELAVGLVGEFAVGLVIALVAAAAAAFETDWRRYCCG